MDNHRAPSETAATALISNGQQPLVPYANIMHISQGVSINNDDSTDIESHRSMQQIQFNRSRRVLEFLIFELIEILPEISL